MPYQILLMPISATGEFVEHPFIKPRTVEARVYQQLIATSVLENGNTLVVLPTGLGKTVVAALVAAERLRQFPDSKVLIVAPTKPLAEQHAESMRRMLNVPEESVIVLTGTVPPERRQKLWQDARIIAATPQTVENDILAGRIDLSDVSLLVIDEAHRAVGNYPYVLIARKYLEQARIPLILALTASPGGTEEKIQEVMRNLFIRNVEIRTPEDPDVKRYVKGHTIQWVRVELPPEFKEILRLLEHAIRTRLRALKDMGIVDSVDVRKYSKKDLLALQEQVQSLLSDQPDREEFYDALRIIAEIIKIQHGLELVETQGASAFVAYVDRMKLRSAQPSAPKSLKRVVLDPSVSEAYRLALNLSRRGTEHPKIPRLVEILRDFFAEHPEARAIIFVQYRDTASKIVDALSDAGISAVRFVGQGSRAGDKGLSQKEQQRIIEDFRTGKYQVLVATSVAEEGLDIPSVDLVVFYEAIPSEIRQIQRRGRTGRFSRGQVYVLVSKGTRDEAYLWAARYRERKMIETLKRLRRLFGRTVSAPGQTTIVHFVQQEKPKNVVEIIVDHRERASGVVEELSKHPDVHIIVKELPVADYILSDRVAVERKSVQDFVNSIIDGRLFEQAAALAQAFSRPVIVVEGKDIYSARRVHPNAIRGAIAALAVDYGIPIVFTKDAADTAAFLRVVARREQLKEGRTPRIRGDKRILSLPEMQLFIVESLPYVGPKLARQLLRHFETVERVFTASERELSMVEGIGPKRAREIRRVLTTPFLESDGDNGSKGVSGGDLEERADSRERRAKDNGGASRE